MPFDAGWRGSGPNVVERDGRDVGGFGEGTARPCRPRRSPIVRDPAHPDQLHAELLETGDDAV